MTIYLGTDHAGFELKEKVKTALEAEGHEVKDLGAFVLDKDDDYPNFVSQVAEAVVFKPEELRGIVFGKSGQGEAMVANRVKGIRAAVYYGGPEDIVKLSREHNDANILSLGAGFINEEEAMKVIRLWLQTPFSGEERHTRRLEKF